MRKRLFAVVVLLIALVSMSGHRHVTPVVEGKQPSCTYTYEMHKLDIQDEYNRCLYGNGWINASPVYCASNYYVNMGIAQTEYQLCLSGFGT